jgi:HEAT repeat protein
MKQRSLIVAAIAMMPLAVTVAQTPPTPPVTPVTPVVPVTPLPSQAPLPMLPGWIDRDEIRRISEDARWQGQLAAEEGRRLAEQGRWLADEARWQAQSALADMKFDLKHDLNFDFKHDFKFDLKNDFHVDFPKIAGQVAPNFEFSPLPGQNGMLWTPGKQQQWQEPCDSAYQLAYEGAFVRQDYSRAAARFAEMIQKFPNCRRVATAAYYQAFALYRVGTLESLRSSLKVLETNEQLFQYNNSSVRNDAPELQARVLRALIERKEPSAEGKLRDLVAKYASNPAVACDKEKMGIQSQVLNSLHQTDPEAAMPYIRQHLQTRDACNATMRRTAVSLLRNRPTPENVAAIVQVARTDTVRSVRSAAVDALSGMSGDDAISALQQLMQDPDDQIQRAAVRSLMRSDNPKARAAMRTLIDNPKAPESQRLEAIRSFDRNNTSPDDAAYLRALFNRQGESDRIKEAILYVLGQLPNEDNLKFMMDVAQNQNESSSIRASALRRVTSRGNLTTDNLIKLYDATDSRSMRQSLVEALGQRPEQAAVNKLLDIVKLSTDPEVRSNAIQILLRKKDPKITEQVLALIR